VEGYFNKESFIEFLEELKDKNRDGKIAIFLDNLRLHKSIEVQNYAKSEEI